MTPSLTVGVNGLPEVWLACFPFWRMQKVVYEKTMRQTAICTHSLTNTITRIHYDFFIIREQFRYFKSHFRTKNKTKTMIKKYTTKNRKGGNNWIFQ